MKLDRDLAQALLEEAANEVYITAWSQRLHPDTDEFTELVLDVSMNMDYDDTLTLMVLPEIAEAPVEGSSQSSAWELLSLATMKAIHDRAVEKRDQRLQRMN